MEEREQQRRLEEEEEELRMAQEGNERPRRRRRPRTKLAVSIRRKSQLFGLLATAVAFASVDEFALLPTGTILYVIALTTAWERWMDELEQNRLFLRMLQNQQRQRDIVERRIEKVKFEYHVLKNRPDVEVFAFPSGGKDDGKWIVYADDKKPRRRRRQLSW